MNLLEVDRVSIAFGGVVAVEQVSFAVRAGEILSIIGPNGAGKTTLFNIVSGLYRPQGGTIRLGGEDVTLLPPHQLARRGLSRTFQNLQVFMGASALTNVMIGRHRWERTSFWADLIGLPSVWRQNAKTRDTAAALLARVGLAALAEHPAASLPYGALKRLEIARALATEPKVLLLDEPAAGCNPVETQEIDALIRAIALDGVGVVLVEHNMKLVMNVSTHVLVLNQGRKLAEGTPAIVRENPEVIAAYLGRHAAEERSAT